MGLHRGIRVARATPPVRLVRLCRITSDMLPERRGAPYGARGASGARTHLYKGVR